MRIPSNQYKSIISFALQELQEQYTDNEIKSLVYYLFEEYLGLSKTYIIINKDKGVSESELLTLHFAIKDLKKGKPIQYILGYGYFMEHRFFVNTKTLIPRPETEELVQYIIHQEKDKEALKILDIGTGTACIPISLAIAMPQHQYNALDFKEEIIDLAKKNAQKHQVNIHFQLKDILSVSENDLEFYDIIISNPPYVLESEKESMHTNVLNFEPASALFVEDNNALLFYQKIISLAAKKLNSKGRIYLEINENKGTEIVRLLAQYGFCNALIHKDIHSKDRFVSALKSN